MAEYKDVAAIKTKIQKICNNCWHPYRLGGCPEHCGINDAVKAIDSAPTVDAVPVRCKDCKFFSHGYCRFHDAKFVRPDGYCYWGEQKEGEQHD